MNGFSNILWEFTVSHPGAHSRLKSGDTVREKLALFTAGNDTGIVLQTYLFDGEYRCVVRFESGREGVYFERELVFIKAD